MNLNIYPSPYQYIVLFHLLVSYLCHNPADSGAVSLTQATVDQTLANNELVFINFYADWCRFSNMLGPIFDEAADKVAEAFPAPGQVVMGKVDCDKEGSIATRFHITKYPTLKVIRNGQPTKREYRGKRSVEAFVDFVKKQLADPTIEFQDIKELKKLDTKKRIIIGFFEKKDCPEYKVFRRSASNLKEDCQFHVGFGEAVRAMHPRNHNIVVFRPDVALSNERDETYMGSLLSYDEINIWMSERCVPLVREITFENAEELTEEGLPFMILFHRPGKDDETVKIFKDIVSTQLYGEKQNINFLTADGERFAHPLHHLGKNLDDLPLIAIDSFRHMYLFPSIADMQVPGKLKAFIQDLYSGKLHREFHYGPDPNEIGGPADPPTNPPESSFRKLGPSPNRYTLLKDEL